MRFRTALIFIVLAGVLGSLYRWSVTPSIGTTNGQISDRAREFIENQPIDDRIIQLDTLDQDEGLSEIRSGESECFDVTFPVSVRNIKTDAKDSGCIIKATSDRPKAHYTISSDSAGSLQKNTGISLREKDERYESRTTTLFPENSYKFFVSSTEVSMFLVLDEVLYAVVLYDSPRTSEQTEQIVLDLAESIQPQ